MNRNIRLINLYTVCTNMLFILPVIIPYYKTIGLTFQQFLMGEAVFSAIVLLSEVPTGWISDTFQRKTSLMVGLLFGVAGFATLIMADGFWTATAGQGLIGVCVAMNSGSVTAILYDSLLQEGRAGEYRRLEGKRHAISLYIRWRLLPSSARSCFQFIRRFRWCSTVSR